MILRVVLLVWALTGSLFAGQDPAWTEPFPPYRVVGNVYYVGSRDLASYLVVTPEGNILINSSLKSSVPLIRRSVEQLGFRFADTRVLLISHAHSDHAAGSAEIKRLTGAKYMVMDGDVPVVETGGKTDFAYGRAAPTYEPAEVDRVLHDGDEVRLGGTVLVAHKTAGHTRGCTTWTLRVADGGRVYDVVIVGSRNVNPGYKLVGNRAYPGIAEDYAATFRTLRRLPCDVFLGAHGSYFGMVEKVRRMRAGGRNPFVDPAGYRAYVAEREGAFRRELGRQEGALRATTKVVR